MVSIINRELSIYAEPFMVEAVTLFLSIKGRKQAAFSTLIQQTADMYLLFQHHPLF